MRLLTAGGGSGVLSLYALVLSLSAGCSPEARSDGAAGHALHQEEAAVSSAEATFTEIGDLLVDSEGFVYVVDRVPHLWILTPTGDLARTVGRAGAGPGEFRMITSAQLAAGDTLFVFDPELSRITAFGPGSSQVAYVTYLREQFPLFPYLAKRLPDGRIVSIYRRAYGDQTGRSEAPEQHDVVRLLSADGGLIRDSVLLLREQQLLDIAYGTGGSTFRYPFGRKTIVRVASDGRIYTAWTDSARFHVYSPEGARLSTIEPRERIPPRPITPQERDSLVAAYAPDGQHAPALRRALERYGHRTWPVLSEFILDDRGRIWYAPTPGREAATNTWTALDERGNARERLSLPANASLRAIRGSRAYVTETDTLDVPRVVVYDIRSEATRRNE